MGAITSILLTALIAYLARLSYPDDPSAGSVATAIVGLFPLGVLIGGGIGLIAGLAKKKKRSKIVPSFNFADPWYLESDPNKTFLSQLRKEANESSLIFDKVFHVVGRRHDCDDVLIYIEDSTLSVAVIHLTWSKDLDLPRIDFYRDYIDWRERNMLPVHNDYVA